jgi:hypothetical protein
MAIKRIPIDSASAAQLAAFAALNLGLDVQSGSSANKLRGQINAAGYDKDFIEIDTDEAAASAPRAKAQAFNDYAAGTRPTKVRLIIQSQPGPGGDEPVFVSVNGSAMYIPRGKEAEIPYRYYEALNNARSVTHENDDREGLKNAREVPVYPFSVLGMN